VREIGAIAGINKSIRHHMVGKTFPSTVLLYNDVPMEVVSELTQCTLSNVVKEGMSSATQ
jgi:hypothetical protein